MNKKNFMGITLSLLFFLLIGCDAKVQESRNSVSVSGIGTVLVQPDMVQMNINFSHTASTTSEAKSVTDRTMQQILKILQQEKIEEKFIKTISLNYDVEYSYESGQRVWVGQRAQQTIGVTVKDIINHPERFPALLDKLAAIDRVEIQNIQFDIENKTELFRKSRELAYRKAFEKANQYAELSGCKLGKVLTISEGINQEVVQSRAFMKNVLVSADEALSGGASVPTGEQGVTSEIHMVFSLE